MRRTLASLLVAIVCAGALGAPASGAKKPKKKVRSMTIEYTSPAIGTTDATGLCPEVTNCILFPLGANERFVSFTIEDQLGLPVPATVAQDTNPGDNFVEVVGYLCGTTEEPMLVTPGVQVEIWPWVVPSAVQQRCAGAASSGSITAKISNLP